MTGIRTLRHAYGRLLHALGLTAAVATLSIMVLVVANIIGRYLFNAPITGAFEVTESLLVITTMLGLALTQYHGGHIRVTILTRRLPSSAAWMAKICSLVIATGFFTWCSYASWKFAYESYSFDEQEWGSITFPLYPVKFAVFFGIVLLTVQFLLDLLVELAQPSKAQHSESVEIRQ
jgi:TRAP-type C4-dicarboxylate transport system permease small subunit